MGARPILVNVITALSGKGIEDAQSKLKGLGGTLDNLSSKALKAGGAFVAFQGGRVFADFATNATVQARDLERNVIALDTVFDEYSETMRSFGASAQQFGLSQSEAAKASVFLGSVLKQSGFSMDEVATQTQRLVELGADLSITYGYDVQEALLGMTALFRGEYDPIEKFGVAMKQSEINAALAAGGFDKLEGAERRLAEQQIRLNLLFERSTDAQGAFARGTGTLFAEQQKLEAAINNMLQQAGTPLLKTMADLAAAMTPLVEQITPTLVAQFEKFVPIGSDVNQVAQELVGTIQGLIEFLGDAAEMFVKITIFVTENIQAVLTFIATVAAYKGLAAVIVPVATAFTMTGTAIEIATAKAKLFKLALARTGIGLIAIAIGTLAAGIITQQEAQEDANSEQAKANQNLKEYNRALQIAIASNNTMRLTAEKINPVIQAIGTSSRFAAGELRRFEDIRLDLVRDRLAGINFELNRVDTSTLEGVLAASGLTREELKPKPVETAAAARNFVKDFFDNLEDEAKKVSATAQLESLGASPALIESIVNFGEGWEKVFNNIVRGGKQAVDELQELFDSTAAGMEELEKIQANFDRQVQEAAERRFERLQKEYEEAKAFADKMQEAADEARDSFASFFEAFDILPTVANDMGRFEQQTVSALAGINDELERTLEKFVTDDGNMFDEAYKNLKAYAANELAALRDIQRQRDQLAQRRSVIESVTEDIMRAGNIVNLLRGINSEMNTTETNTTQVIQDTIKAGKRLSEFRVSIITNLVEPLEQVSSKSDMLVSSYQAVVDRTRVFVENLKALRQLGLDPMLFNQLVQAGVEAGGETAQALVDGGSKTVEEINRLTRDLNQLGAEIGVETADVMYATGETFINSILQGIQSQQDALEAQARSMAEAFSAAFKASLDLAVGTISAEAALRVPPVPQMEEITKDVSGSLGKLNELIAGAANFANTTKNAAFQAGALAKKDIYEQLRADVLQGLDVDISGVRSGLSTGELERVTGRESNVNITIAPTVYANNRAGGAAAGQAIMKEIDTFVKRNGSVAPIIGGVGKIAL